jgi:hypothetical protein
MTHGEAVATAEFLAELEGPALLGAHVYLGITGPIPRAKLIRVLADHLEIQPALADAAIGQLITHGQLLIIENTVSLPAGSDTRENQEN